MFRWSVKIFNYFVLLVTGIALIGVNVRLLHCCHSEDSIVEVRMIPDEEGTPCSDACCGMRQCHTCSQHDFYKITDFSLVEQSSQIFQAVCILPLQIEFYPVKPTCVERQSHSNEVMLWDNPPSCSFLCAYLC